MKSPVSKKALVAISLCVLGVAGCKTIEETADRLRGAAGGGYTGTESQTRDATLERNRATPKSSGVLKYYPPATVKSAQQALNEAGFDAGPADGLFGNKTAKAVRAFQKSRGLTVNGELDDATIAAFDIVEREAPDSPASTTTTTPPEIEIAEPASVETRRVVETTDMKAQPDPFSSTVRSVRAGAEVSVLEQANEWSKVRYQGKEGFIFSEFMR